MLEVSELFSDHAVLQREKPITVWGWTAPRAMVAVELGDGLASAKGCSGDDGRFEVRLPAQTAGGPYRLKVSAGGEEYRAEDLYIGEVWLAGGQSNMEMPLDSQPQPIPGGDKVEYAAPVRMITVPHETHYGRKTRVGAKWTLPEEGWRTWSAAGAFFARRLTRELKVPVGIVASNWGGTIAEAWISRETLSANPDFAKTVADYELNLSSVDYWKGLGEMGFDSPEFLGLPAEVRLGRLFQSKYPDYPENLGVGRGWASRGFDDAGWRRVTLPGAWQGNEGMDFSGAVWFRREVEIPASWTGRELVLSLGSIDKHDVSYFNGVEVGATGTGVETEHWCLPRRYRVAAELAAAGRAVIAVRAYSFMYAGGLHGPAEEMRLYPVDAPSEAIPLAGEWRCLDEMRLPDAVRDLVFAMGLGNANSFSILYDNMIYPLLPFAMRGAIWYQGESNAMASQLYRRLMCDLIGDWRHAFAQPDLAFYQVLLAGFVTAGGDWPALRAAQVASANDTGSGYASAVDIGDPVDIHPLDKESVGERLALRALADTYGCPVEGEGPTFNGLMTLADGRVRLSFTHAAGLRARGGAPEGFEAAGADGRFVPAEAKIAGEYVYVSAAGVAGVKRVRYAWKDYPEEANVYNAAGLPMIPFSSC